ncbi:c-type cytochrome [Novosphingobium sp. FSW06-99]|uniref:c-type cytochrome n=1 Tax=Novosphingobium sp. FSW06-99 TaxID=1739113 RepID=UPI0009EB86B3
MDDRFNTIAGWALFGGIVALGLSSLSSHYFQADKHERPETMGYAIAGADEGTGGGAAAVEPIANRLAKADAAKGEAIFAKCKACHTIDQGAANGIGPNLWAVVGDAIAQGRGGFAFSDGLKAHTGKWDFDQLDKWLTSPAAFATGTKMTFAGLTDPVDRANVILYLNSKGSNLPLPAPVAASAAPAAGAAAATPAVALVGDATAGEKVFAKCKACHTIDQGAPNGIGPNLYGIAGDAIAEGRGGFAFSDGLKAHKGNWDAATLDQWLSGPAKFATGTKMTFAGLDDAKQRADVIAYLNSKGGKLTLGAAPAPAGAAK